MAGRRGILPGRTQTWHHQDMADYRARVRAATDAIDALSVEIEADLDEEAGGIGWWNGHVGWKTSAQLGTYLLASCTGVAESLRHASLVIEEHRQKEFGLNQDRIARARLLEGRPSSVDEKITALTAASDSERRREDLQSVYAEHALVSLAQSLDRLAAVVATVVGVRENVLGYDWGKLADLAEREPRSGPTNGIRQGLLADLGTPGRDLQHQVLTRVSAAHEHGPNDWLKWLIKSRNTAVHRAPRWSIPTMTVEKRRVSGLVSLPIAQPDWADTEAVARSSRGGSGSMFLTQAPQTIFEGLLESVVSLTASLAGECRQIWNARRQDPTLIIQAGASWRPVSKATLLDFPGYGDPAPTVAKEVAMNGGLIRRLRAAKLMGDQVHEWELDATSD